MTEERISQLATEIYENVLQNDCRHSYVRDMIREIVEEATGGQLAGYARWEVEDEKMA